MRWASYTSSSVSGVDVEPEVARKCTQVSENLGAERDAALSVVLRDEARPRQAPAVRDESIQLRLLRSKPFPDVVNIVNAYRIIQDVGSERPPRTKPYRRLPSPKKR